MRQKFIEVYDDLIPPKLQDGIENVALKKMPWYYIQNIATTTTNEYAPGFGHYFIEQYQSTPANQNTLSGFFNNVLYTFANSLNMSIDEIIHGRMFLHLPSPNPTPDDIHVDLNFPHWVCLYYVTDSDGDTILFKDDKKTEIKRITPKKGRIAFFDGSIFHCSSKPSKNTRVIINFDFKGTFLNEV